MEVPLDRAPQMDGGAHWRMLLQYLKGIQTADEHSEGLAVDAYINIISRLLKLDESANSDSEVAHEWAPRLALQLLAMVEAKHPPRLLSTHDLSHSQDALRGWL